MLALFRANVHDERIEKAISVVLRVPGLFLLDYWCRLSTSETWHSSSELVTTVASSLILVQSLLLLLLPLEDLVTLYMHYLCAVLIAGSDYVLYHYILSDESNIFLVSSFVENSRISLLPLSIHFVAIALQVILATLVCFILKVGCNIRKTIFAIYIIPVVARFLHFPVNYVQTLHRLSTTWTYFFILYYIFITCPRLLIYIQKMYRLAVHVVLRQGPLNAAFGAWEWFFLMPQFLVFWCLLVAIQLHTLWFHKNLASGHLAVSIMERGDWYLIILYALSNICTTPVSLMACCIAMSYFSWTVLHLTKVIAQGSGFLLFDRELIRAGATEGVTMALLALQIGLVDHPMPQRMGAMCIILFIVLGSLIQSMHEIVEPILLALSASHSRSLLRHLRVVSVCLFLLVFPLYMTIFLCQLVDTDFWTLVVISTCTLTSFQVLGALIIYGLFVYDALRRDSEWESLDDVVYFTRAGISILEFLVAVLVVGSGVRESILMSTEGRSVSWLSGSVLVVHCYFNVYQRLQTGWQNFLRRREAARKIDSLPVASVEQLKSHSHDECAICYVDLKTAIITPCNHLFHSVCLKKWLYVQDRCPLCSAKITIKQ